MNKNLLIDNNKINDKFLLGLTLIMNQNLCLKLSNFSSFQYYGKDNILHIHPVLCEMKPLGLLGQSLDSLYLSKKIIPKEIQIIYISPHHIFSHETNGQITADLLLGGFKNNITPLYLLNEHDLNSLVANPSHRFRLIDGRSVEMFDNMWKLGTNDCAIDSKDHNNDLLGIRPILGLCDLFSISKRLIYLTQLSDLINKIHQVFNIIKYFPYLIHPYRLLVSETGKFYIMSFSLLHYLFSPHAETKKIKDIVFSHPQSLIQRTENIENIESNTLNRIKVKCKENLIIGSKDFKIYHNYLAQSNCRLLLDMLHSLFVTIIWIANGGGVIHKQHTLVRNYLTLQGNITLKPTHSQNPYKVTSRKPIHNPRLPSSSQPPSQLELTSSPPSPLSNNVNQQLNCQNPYGLCHAQIIYSSFHTDEIKCNVAQHVHNYGCLHLLNYTPTVLEEAFSETLTSHRDNILTDVIENEINIILAFISQIKKELESTII